MKEKLFKKGITRRLFSVVLALAMAMPLMPMNNIQVFAATIHTERECANFGYENSRWTDGHGCSLAVGDILRAGMMRYNRYGTCYVDGASFAEFAVLESDVCITSITGDSMSLKTVTHSHHWNYSNDGATLKAYCSESEGAIVCSYQGSENAVTLTLTASDAKYSSTTTYSGAKIVDAGGTEIKAANTTNKWSAAGLTIPSIKYYKATSHGGTEGTEEVTNLTGLASGDYYASITLGTATVKAPFFINQHIHTWSYSVENDSKLVATCTCKEGDEGYDSCEYKEIAAGADGRKVSLTLSASDANYSGSEPTINIGTSVERAAWTTATLELPTVISYEKADGTPLASAPTATGSYVAKVSPVGVTATAANTAKVSFTIEQAHGTDTSKWASDSTQHWHPCFRSDCTEDKSDIADHSYSESTHKCVCGKMDPDYHVHSYGPWTITRLATATAPGEKERTCACGDKETVATEYEKATDDPTVDSNAGIIENKTDASKNGCGADVKLTKAEIIKKLGLTLDELSKVENGVDISVNLEVEAVDSKNIPSADKDKAEEKLDSDEKIGQYLDINLFKIVGDDKSKVTQLNGKIKIQITLPEEVKKAGTDYFIIRVHDGVATKLDLTHVSGDTYTFETDQFSTYALGYKTDENGKDVTAPKTGDDSRVYEWILLMIAGLGVMGCAFLLKRKEEN